MSLLVQVLFDQRCADAPTLNFVECLQKLINGSDGQLQDLISELRVLPLEFVPYDTLPLYPHIQRILISFLRKLEVAVTDGKNEAAIRKWPKTLFEMMTTWPPEGECDCCGILPPAAVVHQYLRHFSPVLLDGDNGKEQFFDVRQGLLKWVQDTRRVLTLCRRNPRCWYGFSLHARRPIC
jgi:hypothetical protein